MSEATRHRNSAEGRAIDAVDGYLEEIGAGRPNRGADRHPTARRDRRRSGEAARVATEGAWSWAHVGQALGVSVQALHESFARIQDKLDKKRAKP